jgi:tRNA threonylcarbamoyladenosine biosynthesis protein TsaE
MRDFGQALGRTLLAAPHAPVVVYLQGNLGAGKTTLVTGILNAAGFAGFARSPTYTLIEPYETSSKTFYHLDLYRLTDPLEVEPLGLRDLLVNGAVLLIEWPDRGAGMLPPADVTVDLDYSLKVDARHVRLLAASPAGQDVLNGLRQS